MTNKPQYSPDITPMDFALFPYLNSKLRGQRFIDLNDLRYITKDIVQKLDKSWHEDTIHNQISKSNISKDIKICGAEKCLL